MRARREALRSGAERERLPSVPETAPWIPGLRFVVLRQGSYEVGTPEGEEPRGSMERPVHTESLTEFWISTTEVLKEWAEDAVILQEMRDEDEAEERRARTRAYAESQAVEEAIDRARGLEEARMVEDDTTAV